MNKGFLALSSSLSIVLIVAEVTPAIGQDFDPNLVSRIESFVPEPEPVVVPRETVTVPVKREVTEIKTTTERESVPEEKRKEQFNALPESQQRAALTAAAPDQAAGFAAQDVAPEQALVTLPEAVRTTVYDRAGIPSFKTVTVRKPVTKVITELKTKELPRKTVVTFSATAGYSYQTNATQSPTDIVDDSISNNNAGLTVLIPVGRKNDTLGLNVSPLMTRYADLDANSFDMINGQATYTHPLGKRYLTNHRTSGTATQDLFAIALQGQSVHEPGFGAEKIQILTPSVQWERKNIPVSGKICGTPGAEKYCHFANLRLVLGNRSTSISTQDFAAGQLEIIFGWHTPVKGLTLKAGGSLIGRTYHSFPGGREDLALLPKIEVSWAPNSNVTLSAGTSYTDQTSTQSAVEWSGFNVYPAATLSVKF